MLVALAGCPFTEAGPCADYCDYICECHAGEADYDCEGCRAEYAGGADPDLQDECETALVDLQAYDAETGHECGVESGDTATARAYSFTAW